MAGPAGQAPTLVLFIYGPPSSCLVGSPALSEHPQSQAHSQDAKAAPTSEAACSWRHAADAVNKEWSTQYSPALVRVVRVLPPTAATAASRTPSSPQATATGAATGGLVEAAASWPAYVDVVGNERVASRQDSSAGKEDSWLDVNDSWPAVMQLPSGSAVLVRPDGHIAWRYVDGSQPTKRAGVQKHAAGMRDAAGGAEKLDGSAAVTLLRCALQGVLGEGAVSKG